LARNGTYLFLKEASLDLTQKLINSGDDAVDEMLTGVLAAHGEHLWRPDGAPRSVIAKQGPRNGKVGLVIGGGSGHEPTFLGFVGKGLADAAAIGNVFASPPPQPIIDAAKAADGDAGILFMYGNYAGDVMNFDMAAELLELEGIETRTVLTTDDIASAPRAKKEMRRGVAGNTFIFKAAGAAADLGLSLTEVERVAQHANERTFTMGVALSACSLPQTRRPNFQLPAGEMEIGMGIHGEPGVHRGPLQNANAIVDQIMDTILEEMAAAPEDQVAVLVNSLGSTPLMELYILFAHVAERLASARLEIHTSLVGSYCTSLEMAGASITVMHLDKELKQMIEHPCDCAMFQMR
jgi:dihydroxyacetone kinase-like protein